MKKVLEFLKKQPLLTAVIGAAVSVGGIKLLSCDTQFATGLLRVILSLAMCAVLYLISGTKTFDQCEKTTGFVIKRFSGFIIFTVALTVVTGTFAVLGNRVVGEDVMQLQKNIPLQFILNAFICFFVGIFEELIFRAVVNDGIVYQFRNRKGVFAASAVIGSLFFGWVHIMSADVSEPLLFAQAALKTISTGLFGFGLLILYWKTRNIWGCALAHGLYDFLAGINGCIYVSGEKTGDTYVRTGIQGVAGLVTLVLDLILSLIFVIHIWKKVGKTIDFEEMRKSW